MEERRSGSRRLLGNALLLLTALIWGMAFVAQRQGMDSIEPITFCAARMVLSTVAVGLVALLIEAGVGGAWTDFSRRFKSWGSHFL